MAPRRLTHCRTEIDVCWVDQAVTKRVSDKFAIAGAPEPELCIPAMRFRRGDCHPEPRSDVFIAGAKDGQQVDLKLALREPRANRRCPTKRFAREKRGIRQASKKVRPRAQRIAFRQDCVRASLPRASSRQVARMRNEDDEASVGKQLGRFREAIEGTREAHGIENNHIV